MVWTVNFEPRALGEQKRPDRATQKRIVRFLQGRVTGEGNPRQIGKALAGDKAGLWRYRIGTYRVVCRIEDGGQMVLVLRVARCKDVYR